MPLQRIPKIRNDAGGSKRGRIGSTDYTARFASTLDGLRCADGTVVKRSIAYDSR